MIYITSIFTEGFKNLLTIMRHYYHKWALQILLGLKTQNTGRPLKLGKCLLPLMCWVTSMYFETLMLILKSSKSYRGIREQPCGPIFNIQDASHTVLTLIISEIISSFCIYWCIYWEQDWGFSRYCVMAIALSAIDQYLTEYYSRQCPKCFVVTYASVHSSE